MIKYRLRLMAASIALYVIYLAIFIAAPFWVLLLPLAFYEIALRAALRFSYGKHYRYALFNYFLVDDPVYGFAFRKNARAKQAPFPIFDKFALHPDGTRADLNINSLGFRGPEFTPKKTPGTVRIFCSGDSTTAAAFIDDGQTWPVALERELRKRGVNAEVINAGVGAWSSYQERLRFEREIVGYEPDIVLLNQGWNEEFWFAAQNLGKKWRPKLLLNAVEMKSLYARVGRFLSSTISLYFHFLVASYFYDIRFKRSMDFQNPRRWECLKAPEYLQNWFDNLVGFTEGAAARGIKLYTVNSPALCSFADAPEDRALYLQGAKLASGNAEYQSVSKRRIGKTLRDVALVIPCVDAEQELAGTRGADRLELFCDKIHMSPRGNERLAQIIARRLLADDVFAKRGTNVSASAAASGIRARIGINEPEIDDYIDQRVNELYNFHT